FAAALVSRNVALLPIDLGRAARYAMKTGRGAALASARVAFSLARIARSFGVLYANSPTAFLISAAAGLVARRPVVWHLREMLAAPRFNALQIRALVTCANVRAARVVVSSQAVADAFVAAGGRRALVEIIPDGMDAARFDRIGPDVRVEVRRTLEISDRAYVVGSFGSAGSAVRSVLGEALKLLPDVQVLVVDGAKGDHADLPRLIAACDVVVHMGDAARLVVKVLMSRRPLVVADQPGVRELVEDGVTGIVVAPGDAVALAAAIRGLRDAPIRSDEIAFAGAADARRRFSSERMNASITRVVDDVSSHSKQSHDR
ncbi:MAG: glycosyl transferase, group 1 family protein, partial [Gemmatimonadetes bacterium]|nr:glycosyl transferase, group 1 family protein [Gemmatimonadota bacterium]